MKRHRIGIAGAGFSGAVLARELVESGEYEVTVFDERDHVAGNCHTTRDAKTGVMIHNYGPHIFNTSREDVWTYVQRWGKFHPFVNRVKAVTARGIFTLPINLLTINQFFGKTMGPAEAQNFIAGLGRSDLQDPQSFEDQALKFLGRDLYENFFRGYTKKQWGVDPTELPASILKRLPVRFNYDDNYYNQKYQGIPENGYTEIVEKILDHSQIRVHLKTRLDPADVQHFDHVFWCGPLDAFYRFDEGRLQYRTLRFERFEAEGDYQGNAVINYCDESVPFTRIAEHKHFTPWEEHAKTVCFREFSELCKPGQTPYYPLRLRHDKALLERYVERARREKNVTFVGRLGTYRYLDMHVVIGEALDLAKICRSQDEWPAFSQNPI